MYPLHKPQLRSLQRCKEYNRRKAWTRTLTWNQRDSAKPLARRIKTSVWDYSHNVIPLLLLSNFSQLLALTKTDHGYVEKSIGNLRNLPEALLNESKMEVIDRDCQLSRCVSFEHQRTEGRLLSLWPGTKKAVVNSSHWRSKSLIHLRKKNDKAKNWQ